MSRFETTISFHRESGSSIVLGEHEPDSSNPYHLMDGSLGLGMPPVSFSTKARTSASGSVLLGKHVGEREGIVIPILIQGDSPEYVTAAEEALRKLLSPLDERPLYLRVKTRGRADYREIAVHYTGGLEGDYSKSVYRGTTHRVAVEFRAMEALWRGKPQYIDQQVDPGVKAFLSTTESFFPVVLADATVDAQITLFVSGDAPTYPVWKVTPPGEDLLITHLRTGRRFYLDHLFTEPVTIDMGRRRVTSPSLPNNQLWDKVSLDSRMFPLDPGDNTLEFSMVGSSTASRVEVTYYPRYLGGH